MSDLGPGRINRAAAANLPMALFPSPLHAPPCPPPCPWRAVVHCDVLVSWTWQIALPTLIVILDLYM
jgi:hypothetical protein